VEQRLGIDLHGGRTFNKLGREKSLCPNRIFCFKTVKEKGNYFWKGDIMRMSNWERNYRSNEWTDPKPFNKFSPNLFKTNMTPTISNRD